MMRATKVSPLLFLPGVSMIQRSSLRYPFSSYLRASTVFRPSKINRAQGRCMLIPRSCLDFPPNSRRRWYSSKVTAASAAAASSRALVELVTSASTLESLLLKGLARQDETDDACTAGRRMAGEVFLPSRQCNLAEHNMEGLLAKAPTSVKLQPQD